MASSTSGISPQQLPQNLQTNNHNHNNNGLIGDGSNNIVNTQVNQFNITQVATDEREDVELDRLLDPRVSKDALRNSFYSPPECHPNTRTTILKDISLWLDESVSKKSSLLWLNGPAAVGKSVIAKTISGFHQQIVATFFFSTSSDKTAATLFPTLAWQLARKIPDTRKHIIASLKESGSLPTSQIEEQFHLLIIQPLKSTTTLECRPVMVIDGVDECTNERMLERFLRVLVQTSAEGGDMPVRFIICSRPEPRIRAMLEWDHDVNRTGDWPEPRQNQKMPSGIKWLIGGCGIIVLFQLIGRYAGYELHKLVRTYVKFFYLSAFCAILLGSLLLAFLILIQLSFTFHHDTWDFRQGIWELYRLKRLHIDKDAIAFPTSDQFTDTDDTICPHPVISIIRIGFSQECKDDMKRYLTDKFNEIRQPGDGTTPSFQPSDISDLVEASCGQCLYVSTIVRLLDDPLLFPRDVLEMARSSSLPAPDLDELYKVILKRTQEGRPDYQFVKDSLAILVFFAGNVHFLTIQKKFLIIEFLLGLKKGKLNEKLCKMHSVLSIVPGESVGVYHRSFLEFLLDHRRSGEYHIGYSYGLRRILILMIRAQFRYHTMYILRQSSDDDDKKMGLVHDMITASTSIDFYGYFGSVLGFSSILFILHTFLHLMIFLLLITFLGFSVNHLVQLSHPAPFLFLGIIFVSIPGTFIVSLMIYIFFLSRSIIIPFFHPFLHPFFMSGFSTSKWMLIVFLLPFVYSFLLRLILN